MKKILSIALSVLTVGAFAISPAMGQAASGTTFVFSPSSQNANPGGVFNVSLSLTGTTPPPNITAYDLYLVTASANSGFFSITGSTATGPFSAFGPSGLPSPLSTAAEPGFVRNDENLGYSGTAQNAPYNLSLQSISITIDASTPVGTYTFFSSTVANAGAFFSDVTSDQNDPNNPYSVAQGQFSINVVPEPSTWAILVLGGISAIGLQRIRSRSRA